ncbi:MAG TPA: TonB-dependent receptor plug domain-containing protein, partial [Saprospiraceae bacterium]|nr:TonB-dependent receptor plug domain-containing protein [Saprospiraceae bacterium]
MQRLFTLLTLLLGMLVADSAFAQRTIKGTVTDADTGEGLIGASVTAIGGSGSTATDINGNYSLNASGNVTGLRFSYLGYGTQDVALSDVNVVSVALKSSAFVADEVVVIGSRNQTRTKVSTPVPVDVIPVASIVNEVGQVDINQILTYVAPSFQSARQAIADGTDHVDPAQLRGLGPDQVLVLVNGKRRHQSALVNVNGTVNRGTVGTDMAAIPASAVERIEILRDGASAQYGSDAIAGVINIVLKNRVGVLDGSISVGQNMSTYDRNYALQKLGRSNQLTQQLNDGETVQAGLNYGWALGDRGRYNMTVEYISRGETNRTGTYTGQIYPSIGGTVKDDSILGARGLNREDFDMRIGQSRMKGGGATFNMDYDLSGGWEVYAFGGAYRKQGNAAGFYRYPNSVVSNAKAYAPQVLALYPNGFLPEIQSTVQDLSAAVGVRGNWKNWNVDLSNTFGHNRFNFEVGNSVNYTQVSQGGELQT